MKHWPLFILFIPFICFAQDFLDTLLVTETNSLHSFTTGIVEEKKSHEFFSTSGQINQEMNSFTSLFQVQSGGVAAPTSIYLRGSESRHILFTLDGHRLNDVSTINRDFDLASQRSIDIQKISLIATPEPAVYGTDAVSGVVNLETDKGENKERNKISIGIGDFATSSIAGLGHYYNKKSHGSFHFSHLKTAGISTLNKKRFNATNRDGSEVWQVGSSGALQWTSSLHSTYLFRFNRNRSENDNINQDTNDFSKTDQLIIGHKIAYKDLFIRQTFNKNNRLYQGINPKRDAYQGMDFFNQLGKKIKFSNFELLGIYELDIQDALESKIDKSIAINSVAPLLTYKRVNSKTVIGLRSSHHPRYGQYSSYSLGHEQIVSGELLSLAKISRGFKFPTLYQNFAPGFGGGKAGNPDLKPEVNQSAEIGVKYKKTELTLFQNHFSNLIQFNTTQGYVNTDWLTTKGVELRQDVNWHKFDLNFSTTYLYYSKSQESLLRRPKYMHKANAIYKVNDKNSFRLEWRQISRRFDSRTNKTYSLREYQLFNLGYSYRKDTWEFALGIKNIFNQKYEDIYGYGVLPRYAEANLTYFF